MHINIQDFRAEDYGVDRQYLSDIINLINQNSEKYIPNHSEKHAELLADLVIGKADKDTDVLIYSGKLPMSCYQRALERCQGNIKILVEQDDEIPEALKQKNKITFRTLKKELLGRSPHFFVAGNAFRFETNQEIAAAVANFNNEKDAGILKNNFSILWEQSGDFQ